MNGDTTVSYTDPSGVEYALNDGVRVLLAPNGLRGFGVVRAEIPSARRPYRDGVYRLGGPYTPGREMQVALVMRGEPGDDAVDWEAFNRQMMRNCSAYKDTDALGSLKIAVEGGVTRQIDCWMVEWPDPERQGPLFGTVTPTFWAESPWFYDPTLQTYNVSLSNPAGIEFPITFPITFATADVDAYIYPDNEGDVPTWPTIRVYGPGLSPQIDNVTTGKLLYLNSGAGLTLDDDDYVDIDMDAATVTMWDNSEAETVNVIEYLSGASEFWPLVRGPNTVRVRMTNAYTGSITFSFYLYYQSR